ncbi:MAG: glycosyltransferase family 39 protein [Planctomycetota bacterium]
MCRSGLLETVAANRYLLLTLVVALAVRLVLAVAIQHRVDQPPARLCLIAGDAEGYWELAQHIVAMEDFAIYQPPRYVLRVPGFPLVLALSQAVFGNNVFAARCLLAIIGTATCGLTYWLGRELVDETTGLIAAGYTAVSPTMALFSVLMLSETLFAFTLLLSLIAIARLVRRKDANSSFFWRSLVAGGSIGLATLVRPTWLYVGLLIAVVAILLCRGALRFKFQSLAGVLVGIGLSMAPWALRNGLVTGHLVFTTLWAGPSLYDGLNPQATGDSDMRFVETDRLFEHLSEYEVDREYSRRAWKFVSEYPQRALWLAWMKQQRYWSLVPNADQFRDIRLQAVVFLAVLPLMVFAIYGGWLSRRDPATLVMTTGAVLLFAALHLLFVGSLRYRLPAEYPLAVLAAVGVRSLFLRFWRTA